ncbi:MAG: hypothetical protein P0116_03050 [Candidatus Nitrosocosmicus sp.]|nr:hypothetical protein [Candidatus Nitrosocosmicus sp.]
MSQYVMHHDSRYLIIDEFNPDRWTDEFKRHLPRFSYFIWRRNTWLYRGIFLHGKRVYYVLPFQAIGDWLIPNQKIRMDPGLPLILKMSGKFRLVL